MKKIIAIVAMVLFVMNGLLGCVEKQEIEVPSISSKYYSNPKYKMSSFYKMEGVTINATAPSISLPLDINNVKNADAIERLNLTEGQKKFLKEKGFVIINYGKIDDISKIYMEIRSMRIPIFITTDTFLHLYHIQFNELLKELEEKEFYDELTELTKEMFEKEKENYERYDGILKEAARRNVAYFGVAIKLLNISYVIPSYVSDEVNDEIKNINLHEGMKKSPIFHYDEDYSQYVPRGHYTQSEKLKRYFKTMMWYGRMAFLLEKGLVSKKDANIATLQAAMISIDLDNVKINDKTGRNIWDRIYSITSFFVGTSDDLTPYEYLAAINKIFGKKFEFDELKNETKLDELREKLKNERSPRIYSGSGLIMMHPGESWNEKLNETKGMRFMGQRYVPDSYIFQQLVSPTVGMYTGSDSPFTLAYTEAGAARCFPRGLDLMAILGSNDALHILEREGDTEYSGINTSYEKQIEKLRSEFASLNISEWNHNLYFSWLFTLLPLLEEFGDGYPSFMRTKEWRYKELQTALASWVELRHDTILYAKQSYTVYLTGMPPASIGYIEPVPKFYARLYSLVNMTINGLRSFNALNETQENRLVKLREMIKEAFKITVNELEGKSIDEYKTFFTNFVDEINRTMKGFNKEARRTILIADVHTDTNTMKCLEEGVGYVDLVIVAFRDDNAIYFAAGPILSYYEFKQPVKERLNDDEWASMVETISKAPWQNEIYPK